MLYRGGCHCGAITLALESVSAAADLPVRECQCGFCRKHSSRATTDHAGRLTVSAPDPEKLSRYRFGMQTADFLVCRACGVYVAALTVEDPTVGIAIVNALEDRRAFDAPPVATDYSAESRDERIARRQATWTPARLVLGPQ